MARRGPRLAGQDRIGILVAGCRGSMPRRAAAGVGSVGAVGGASWRPRFAGGLAGGAVVGLGVG
jgi:hypothetical protein